MPTPSSLLMLALVRSQRRTERALVRVAAALERAYPAKADEPLRVEAVDDVEETAPEPDESAGLQDPHDPYPEEA